MIGILILGLALGLALSDALVNGQRRRSIERREQRLAELTAEWRHFRKS